MKWAGNWDLFQNNSKEEEVGAGMDEVRLVTRW